MLATCTPSATLDEDRTHRSNGSSPTAGLEMPRNCMSAPDIVVRHELSINALLDHVRVAPLPGSMTAESRVGSHRQLANAYDLSSKYNAICDMETCCGNTAEPHMRVDDDVSPEVKVYCSVDKSFLCNVCVKQSWLIAVLKCRPEMCDSTYPPLTEKESEVKQEILNFIENNDSGEDDKFFAWK